MYLKSEETMNRKQAVKPEYIRVACRVRPAEHDYPRMWVTHGKVIQATVVQPGYGIETRTTPPKKQSDLPSFTFEQVFGEDAVNLDVYENFGRASVQKAVEGCKATLLLYGQTGSGKTHSISGSRQEAGMFAHAIRDIFKAAQGRRAEGFACTLSVVAIHNERALDMLHAGTPEPLLVVGPGMLRNRYRQPATEKSLGSVQEALDTFRIAELRRHYAATLKNSRSSRSHTIFKINVTLPVATRRQRQRESQQKQQQDVGGGQEREEGEYMEGQEEGEEEEEELEAQSQEVTSGCLYIVDLAGSESTKESGATGARKREAENINKGLLALTEVLSHMSKNLSEQPPYRRSALTRVLQPCLGGAASNAFASMVFCIDPLNLRVSEKTLKYGVMTKVIRMQYGINVLKQRQHDDSVAQLAKLRREVEHLRAENLRLEEQRLAMLIMWRKGCRPWLPGWIQPDTAASAEWPSFSAEDFPDDSEEDGDAARGAGESTPASAAQSKREEGVHEGEGVSTAVQVLKFGSEEAVAASHHVDTFPAVEAASDRGEDEVRCERADAVGEGKEGGEAEGEEALEAAGLVTAIAAEPVIDPTAPSSNPEGEGEGEKEPIVERVVKLEGPLLGVEGLHSSNNDNDNDKEEVSADEGSGGGGAGGEASDAQGNTQPGLPTADSEAANQTSNSGDGAVSLEISEGQTKRKELSEQLVNKSDESERHEGQQETDGLQKDEAGTPLWEEPMVESPQGQDKAVVLHEQLVENAHEDGKGVNESDAAAATKPKRRLLLRQVFRRRLPRLGCFAA
eukprot:jgi/Mesen1/2704/ME000167S01853